MAKTIKAEKITKDPKGTQKVTTVEDASKALEQSQQEKETSDEKETSGDSNVAENISGESTVSEPETSDDEAGEEELPVPTAKQIEDSANMLADNPELMEAFRTTLQLAEGIIAERNKPEKMTAEELKAANHAKIVSVYGNDFVKAQKGNNKSYYSRKSWNQMGANHRGWIEVTDVMPEVANAAKAKA